MNESIPPVPPVPSAPSVPPVLPPVEKSNKWLKILLAAIGVLIVVGLFGNLYLLARNQKPTAKVAPTPTLVAATTAPDPTAGWKVYENAKLGLSFKYPESLMLCEDVNFTGLISSGPYANPEGNQCEVAKSRGYPISFLLNKDDKEFQNFRAENYPNSFSNYKNTEMKIDNKNAEVISGIEKETLLAFKILKIRMGDSFLIIKAMGEERDITTLDQILSTFKFLEPTSEATGNLKEAKEALINYFSLLSEGKYAEAVKYHGSGYDYLINWNPSIKPNDYPKLLENGCTQNGLHCLRIKGFVSGKEISAEEYLFAVQFANQGGSLFKRGPCCGATEAEMPTKTDFEFTVKKEGNNYLVVTQPVYTP